jgi:hypothetical protein
MVPGTNIGLGGWDLIGIFGGVPFFCWIAFCMLTRIGRTKRFERHLFEASSEEQLSEISDSYERSLMLRMIGPHQALRLERIRSNLEVNFKDLNRHTKEYPDIENTTMGFTEKFSVPTTDLQGNVHTDGYEWLDYGGRKWYRGANTGGEWTRWQ